MRNALMSRNIASLWGKHTGVNSENLEIPPMTLLSRCAVSRYVVDPSNALSLILIMLFIYISQRPTVTRERVLVHDMTVKE
jgi:hypothetical protein